ncbi:MobA/MobL family protein [uncultured Jannaschia sp.]|uniref:MobA/MobL family protein n=1 Tax=uncultured Jannaschia sp. TaxID=293347 RepID=UPI002620E09E|nr:MobA/MobL family protein [uncultured Jannaschia sp.]
MMSPPSAASRRRSSPPPHDAPGWAENWATLWKAAEAAKTCKNAVATREWELALPAKITAAERARIARDFASALVARPRVVADVAICAPCFGFFN